MRLFELFQPILEGYKEAQADFERAADAAEVKSTIDAYRQLVNKNQYQGDERNIDYWRKQGWEEFSDSVKELSNRPTKTSVKRSKNVGRSIILEETAEWLIVIPLDKDASCFHGKGTDWCTAKPFAHHYERYFYRNDCTLIYFINKSIGGKWAIAVHADGDTAEYFDQADASISQAKFDSETGLSSQRYIDAALGNQHSSTMTDARAEYKRYMEYINSKKPFTAPDAELEKALLYVKDPALLYDYAGNALDAPWPAAEQYIRQDPEIAVGYALEILGKPWPAAEPYMLREPGDHLLAYAARFKPMGWPEAEPAILKDPVMAAHYAIDVLGEPWPEGEDVIRTDAGMAKAYYREFGDQLEYYDWH